MKMVKEEDVCERIEDQRSRIQLMEHYKLSYYQTSQDAIARNRKMIKSLRAESKEKLASLAKAWKMDHTLITKACKDRKEMRLCMERSRVQDVKETLNRKLYTRVNLCNTAGFQVRQRERQLQTLQDRLAAMGKLSTPDETGVQEQQWIRQLENSTEKMLIKAAAAKKLQVTYMKILEFLQEEVRRMPLVVSDAEAALKTHSAELQTLTQITQDATADMQHAKMALDGLEQDYTEERKARDISLAVKKKMGAAEKLCYKDIAEKSVPRRERLKDPKTEIRIISETSMTGLKTGAMSYSEIQAKLCQNLEKLKGAVGCSDIKAIEGRLVNQRAKQTHLLGRIAECEAREAELRSRLKELQLEHAQHKFHLGPETEREERRGQQLTEELEREERRRNLWSSRLHVTEDVLHSSQDGLDDLFLKLYSFTLDSKKPVERAPLDSYDKLISCELKMLKLLDYFLSLSPPLQASIEEHDKVWHFMETTASNEPGNVKIPIQLISDTASEDSFQFLNQEQDYSLSREEIKKRGSQLIEKHVLKKPQPAGPKS
ncbi:coiled-coil domain-containing protein 183-like [Huso huso]|uniref:Coiled-coil domain-containing protein 183-like n=1 Tax=Huso huso TaxID=61971 RepID=A0ABR0YEA4_HUSHU